MGDCPSNVLTGNLFLDHLPTDLHTAFHSALERIPLESGTPIYEPGVDFEWVYFPTDSVLSNVLEMSNGATAEVGIIGREGMSGLVLVLGRKASNQRTVVQVPGFTYRMPVTVFDSALDDSPGLKAATLRYVQAMMMSSAQLTACNGLHQLNERCARWLLMAHDRVDGDSVRLTQEFLSQMLGVRRGGVTLAASTMQRAGFISYTRGRIEIRDRAGLESATCECYGEVERNWKAIMAYPVSKSR